MKFFQVATIDNFNENKYPTYVTATTVIIFLMIIAIATISLSQVIVWRLYNLLWPCFTGLYTRCVICITNNCYSSFCFFYAYNISNAQKCIPVRRWTTAELCDTTL